MPKLALFEFNHEFIDQSMNYSCMYPCLPKYPSKSNMQGAVPFHACLFLTAVALISLTNWDNHLVQSVNEKKAISQLLQVTIFI